MAKRLTKRASSKNIVVGIVAGEWVVAMPESRFHGFKAMRAIEANGGTWRDLREAAPSLWSEEIECRFDDEDDLPSDDEPFNMYHVPGAEDGDWPFFMADMLEWVPKEIQQSVCEIYDTALNGPYLHIEPTDVERFMEALQNYGFECSRDDAGMTVACGH